MEFKMITEIAGQEKIYSVHIIENHEVIGSESFDNFEQCAESLINAMTEQKINNDIIETTIINMLRRDIEDKYTGFLLDLLSQHYRNTEWEM